MTNKLHDSEPRTKPLFPKVTRYLMVMGENIRLARKRRLWTTANLAERAGISRTTLVSIEKGSPSVTMGHYAAVLFALGMSEDLSKLAADDREGRTMQDIATLSKRVRRKRVL